MAMLKDDSETAVVRTLHKSDFPKGTVGRVSVCRFIPGTSCRVYLFQTEEEIEDFVPGTKFSWYLEKDLINV